MSGLIIFRCAQVVGWLKLMDKLWCLNLMVKHLIKLSHWITLLVVLRFQGWNLFRIMILVHFFKWLGSNSNSDSILFWTYSNFEPIPMVEPIPLLELVPSMESNITPVEPMWNNASSRNMTTLPARPIILEKGLTCQVITNPLLCRQPFLTDHILLFLHRNQFH